MWVSKGRRLLLPAAAGVLGSATLAGIYFGIVSLAESPAHAWEQFRQDALYIIPILLGFGFQVALYVVLRRHLHLPSRERGAGAALTGAGGGTSAAAMVACCAHHVTDVLPIIGMTAATAFLAQYQEVFMAAGLVTTLGGIAYMLHTLRKERRRAVQAMDSMMEVATDG